MKLKRTLLIVVEIGVISVAPILLIGCNSRKESLAVAVSSESQTEPTLAARKQFLADYRHAHEKSDVDAAMRLVCLDHVTKDTIDALRQSLADDSRLPLKSVDIVPLEKNEHLEYTMRGVRYVPNLAPVGKLSIVLATGTDAVSTTTYLVGVKNGRYWIATSMKAP